MPRLAGREGDAALFEGGEEFFDGFLLAGEDEVGTKAGERFEDEAAQVRAGMGDDETHLVDTLDAVVDNIEVERAGIVDAAQGASAAPEFEFLEDGEEAQRGQFDGVDFDFGDGVEERGGAGRAVDGGGFNPWRFADFVGGRDVTEEGNASVQLGVAVAEVRPEGDADGDEGHSAGGIVTPS